MRQIIVTILLWLARRLTAAGEPTFRIAADDHAKLLDDVSGDTNGAWFTIGKGWWTVTVEIGGSATVTFDYRQNSTAGTVPLEDNVGVVQLTASGMRTLRLPAGDIRAVASGVSGGNVTVRLDNQ